MLVCLYAHPRRFGARGFGIRILPGILGIEATGGGESGKEGNKGRTREVEFKGGGPGLDVTRAAQITLGLIRAHLENLQDHHTWLHSLMCSPAPPRCPD